MTYSVQDQIAHEKKHADLSAKTYYHKQDKLRANDKGDEADAPRNIMRKRVEEVGLTIELLSSRKGGVGGAYNHLLRTVATFEDEPDFNVLAYMGIQAIFQVQGLREGGKDWITIATAIASRLEFEHKARAFENAHPGYYYTVMQSMEEQKVTSYSHIRNVLSKKMEDFGLDWPSWDIHTKIQLANKILISILHNMPDVFFRSMRYQGTKTIAIIDTTPDADDWLAEFEAEKGFLHPVRLPTLIEPQPWVRTESGEITGGYYSYRLSTNMVKAYSKEHKEYLRDFPMEQHIKAINKLQATEWTINQRILAVQQEIFADEELEKEFPGIPIISKLKLPPPDASIAGVAKADMNEEQLGTLEAHKATCKAVYREDKARQGKIIQYKMTHSTALLYAKYDKFHYVYTPDFRGRIYSDTTGLSPQGTDTAKALLQFANGKEVTESGLFWLAVHGANTFGYDKVSFQDRVDWIYEQTGTYKLIARDPIGYREYWEDADKPWQYLAFIYAWADTNFGADTSARTFIPIGLDGSCNGLQHYSALLRDSVGGRGVNLTNSEVPGDIYADVSARLYRNLQLMGSDEHDGMGRRWLKTGLGRKLTKHPVMTLPYGSTQTSARAYVHAWALENPHLFPGMNTKEIYDACVWLTPHLWQAIGEVVIAAREAMSWIQSRVRSLVKNDNDAITWTSPVAFPVYQPYMIQETIRVRTRTTGGINCDITVNAQNDTKDVSKAKQRSGIAPNFVHSLDSSHMVMVINNTDFVDYAMIHDDFGTHAADTGKLFKVIREQFLLMYQDVDPLKAWSLEQGDYTGDYPEIGDLNIEDVLDSEFFFG